MPTATPVLVSYELCPYVQRVAITLLEKGATFDRRWIDLADKPGWFLEISPLGKVPVLRVGDTTLFESAVICNYLDDVLDPPMVSPDPLRRAVERAWAEHASATLSTIGAFYNAPDAGTLEAHRQTLQDRFRWLDGALHADGPWFSGAKFGLVDAAYAPVFRYLTAFDTFSNFELLERAPQVSAWRIRLAARPSVNAAVVADFDEKLLAFMRRKDSQLGRLARAYSSDPAAEPTRARAADQP